MIAAEKSGPRLGLQDRARGQDDVQGAAAVVGGFRAVDERPALDGHETDVVRDRRMGDDATRLHRQEDVEPVPFLPGAADSGEALVQIERYRLPVDPERDLIIAPVIVPVEIGRHGPALGPAGDPDARA